MQRGGGVEAIVSNIAAGGNSVDEKTIRFIYLADTRDPPPELNVISLPATAPSRVRKQQKLYRVHRDSTPLFYLLHAFTLKRVSPSWNSAVQEKLLPATSNIKEAKGPQLGDLEYKYLFDVGAKVRKTWFIIEREEEEDKEEDKEEEEEEEERGGGEGGGREGGKCSPRQDEDLSVPS